MVNEMNLISVVKVHGCDTTYSFFISLLVTTDQISVAILHVKSYYHYQ